jgi:VCBS repeat-containing protein
VTQLLVNPDGTLLVAGATNAQWNGWDNAVARYTADGRLDTSFGVGIEPTARGIITALDPDPMPGSYQGLLFTAVNQGTYGNFEMLSPDYGYWVYTLDSSRATTAALHEGETAIDTITVAIRDSFGGVTYQDVAITVVGAYDPPAG